MLTRSPIVALLWLTYALLLGHSLLPHHHHDEDYAGHSAPHHLAATRHDQHQGDHNADSDDNGAAQADWWFCHQHTPGVEYSDVNAPDTYQAPLPAGVLAVAIPSFVPAIRPIGQTVGWPPTSANAPPERYRYRPLRAPPLYCLVA